MSTLPGHRHELPEGAKCDEHPDREAVANVQGETDSFGFETVLMCKECLDADRAYEASAEAHTGRCDWCKRAATDLAWTRDYDEGMHGPTYHVCAACRHRRDEEAERELAALDPGYWDYPEEEAPEDEDLSEDCGRMSDGSCMKVATEFCDWECPLRSLLGVPTLTTDRS